LALSSFSEMLLVALSHVRSPLVGGMWQLRRFTVRPAGNSRQSSSIVARRISSGTSAPAMSSYPQGAKREEASMSATGLEVFDKSIQTTNIWLDDIMEDIGPDRQLAWQILGAVLRTMRD